MAEVKIIPADNMNFYFYVKFPTRTKYIIVNAKTRLKQVFT